MTPKEFDQSYTPYQGIALIADPLYNYIIFTVPKEKSEITEKDLIDTPWVQRLRRIHQLQSARWVYPSAEHSRFQHSLGTMHMAGEFAKHLYPSLKNVCPDTPSMVYIEELLRIAGLLHDIGHGPYGHFFDENFLDEFGLNHEILGQAIIVRELGSIIRKIRRSPNGYFQDGEEIDPRYVAFLIKKPPSPDKDEFPRWLIFLQSLFSGIYTVDNLDYVQRDAYMSGFSLDLVDIRRLLFYSFFSEKGLTLHQAGIDAFRRFLNARIHLYTNVYYHRTTRAIDFHMQEIFRDTLKIVFPYNPIRNLKKYLFLNDWSLIQEVENWTNLKDPKKRSLGKEWKKILHRKVKWKMAYSTELTIDQAMKGLFISASPKKYEEAIKEKLPSSLRKIQFRVDLAMQDPRPLNPIAEGNKIIYIYNPSTRKISSEPLGEIFRYIPARVVHFRVFALNHNYDTELALAAQKVLSESQKDIIETNI